MRISKRGEYALRALIDLGIAQELDRPMLRISELARREKIPIKFLEAILLDLKKAGYLGSKLGRSGGYSLKQPMNRVTIGEIVRLIDGPLAPIKCVSVTAYEKCSCPDETHCGLRMLMQDVRNSIASILDNYTLADTVEVTLRKYRRDGLPVPFAPKKPKTGRNRPA
jgi:Rrf2 family protein